MVYSLYLSMPSLPATDEWVVASTSSTALIADQQLASPASTPTKRASRSSRISNNVDYAAFARTTEAASIEFRVGDTVIIDHTPKLGQKFLAPPPYLVQKKRKQSKKCKGKRRADPVADAVGGISEVGDDDEVWRHEDGLKAGEKVGIITRLYEDERGRKMALVRWFARPGAVWGPDGPEADEDADPVLPVSLLFRPRSPELVLTHAELHGRSTSSISLRTRRTSQRRASFDNGRPQTRSPHPALPLRNARATMPPPVPRDPDRLSSRQRRSSAPRSTATRSRSLRSFLTPRSSPPVLWPTQSLRLHNNDRSRPSCAEPFTT